MGNRVKIVHRSTEQERLTRARSIEFLKEQISFKDQRMDLLLKTVQDKDYRYDT